MDLEAIKFAIVSNMETIRLILFPIVLCFDIALTCYNEIFKEQTTNIMKVCDLIFVGYLLWYGNRIVLLFNCLVLLVFFLMDKQKNFHKPCVLFEALFSVVSVCLAFSSDSYVARINSALIISIAICKLIAIFSKQIVIDEEEFIHV